MVCPHCGEETHAEDGICGHCGGALATGARWGVRTAAGQYSHISNQEGAEQVSSFVAARPALRKATSSNVKVAAGVVAIALVAAMGIAGYSTAVRGNPPEASSSSSAEAVAENPRTHDVLISVVAEGMDAESTPLPLHVTGGDAAGNAYDEIAFVKNDGSGLSLPAGNYGIEPVASPISSQGGLYLYSGSRKWFSVDEELERGASLDLREEVSVVLQPADAADLTEDDISSAREYAIMSGIDEGAVDALLEAAQAAMAATKDSVPFSLTQTYRNTTFVGDVRTSLSYAPAAGIEGVQPTPVRTDMFLFGSNTLFYAGNSYGSSNTQIALHARNMTTGQESILATDMCSMTRPFYINGHVVYQSLGYSQGLQYVDAKGGEPMPLNEQLPWNASKLVGAADGKALVATADGQLPELFTVPLGEGEVASVALGDTYGNVVGVYDDAVLVHISDWSQSKLVAYGLDGTQKWETEIPAGCTFDYRLSVAEGGIATVSNAGQVVWIAMDSGEVKTFDTGVPYLYGVMLQRDGHIFFAGSESGEWYGSDTVTYITYDLNTADGAIANLGSYEAPQDEELQQQQQSMSWDYTWSDTSTYTGDATWGDTQDYATDTTWTDAQDYGYDSTAGQTWTDTQDYGYDYTQDYSDQTNTWGQ